MNQRSLILRIRVTPHERQQLQRLAGDLPLAQYLRSVGLSGQGTQPDWRRSLIEQVDNIAVALDDLKRQHPHLQERLDAIEQRLLDLEQRVFEEC